MLRVWDSPESRPTRDIDFLGRIDNDRVLIAERVRAVLDQPVEPDGMVFDAASLSTETIVEDARYEGVRVRFFAYLGTARIRMQLDIGFGDIVHPAPQRAAYPAMLDSPAPEILCYSRESAIARKPWPLISSLPMPMRRSAARMALSLIDRQLDIEHREWMICVGRGFDWRSRALELIRA